MPAEKPLNRYSRPGMLRPLKDRQSELEYRRRKYGFEFRQGVADIRSFPAVKKYLGKVLDEFDERYGKYEAIFEAWHEIRVFMLDVPLGTPNYMNISQEKTAEFDQKFFKDSSGKFDEDKYLRVKPVLVEITNVVARSK